MLRVLNNEEIYREIPDPSKESIISAAKIGSKAQFQADKKWLIELLQKYEVSKDNLTWVTIPHYDLKETLKQLVKGIE